MVNAEFSRVPASEAFIFNSIKVAPIPNASVEVKPNISAVGPN